MKHKPDPSVVVLFSLAAMRMRGDGFTLMDAIKLFRRVWKAGRK